MVSITICVRWVGVYKKERRRCLFYLSSNRLSTCFHSPCHVGIFFFDFHFIGHIGDLPTHLVYCLILELNREADERRGRDIERKREGSMLALFGCIIFFGSGVRFVLFLISLCWLVQSDPVCQHNLCDIAVPPALPTYTCPYCPTLLVTTTTTTITTTYYYYDMVMINEREEDITENWERSLKRFLSCGLFILYVATFFLSSSRRLPAVLTSLLPAIRGPTCTTEVMTNDITDRVGQYT